ncbi:3-dehydroquinate synthase [Microtetraspora sp. NBRC 13810]|uniref:2-deoxy-scyllo-inosose synthase n=1 Tax=Microtetraspora sp. NBRC 13810 TaxID=3030990 RepID=UPI0024A28F88|nr:2-deoxy-scyllo-inosose synthase [Microtetraspora sp. NBRC 13810]GLW05854.1 3-dehydroquinate synthase [Microtetraspora sp. NBRC 13810]
MKIEICLGSVRFPFHLSTDALDELVERLLQLSASRYVIVCDSNVAPLYGKDIVNRLSGRAVADLLVHGAGEQHKNLQTVNDLMETALRSGTDRASVIVAVGGGVTGNIAGLMAALMFRGIRLVHVPTSLVAMLDSVYSLKQAINSGLGKNLIGTFYAPEEVLADTSVLRTLPRREMISGMCEVVKNALAIRPQMTDLLLNSLQPDSNYADEALRPIIVESLAAKKMVVADDEQECRAGMALEYGHTVGHALEYTALGALSHGEAVGLGMIVAAEVSHRLGHLDEGTLALHRDLLSRAGATCTVPAGIDLDEVAHRLRFDNKRGYLGLTGDAYAMVLLGAQGQPLWTDSRPLVEVPGALVREVLAELSTPEELVAPPSLMPTADNV